MTIVDAEPEEEASIQDEPQQQEEESDLISMSTDVQVGTRSHVTFADQYLQVQPSSQFNDLEDLFAPPTSDDKVCEHRAVLVLTIWVHRSIECSSKYRWEVRTRWVVVCQWDPCHSQE